MTGILCKKNVVEADLPSVPFFQLSQLPQFPCFKTVLWVYRHLARRNNLRDGSHLSPVDLYCFTIDWSPELKGVLPHIGGNVIKEHLSSRKEWRGGIAAGV